MDPLEKARWLWGEAVRLSTNFKIGKQITEMRQVLASAGKTVADIGLTEHRVQQLLDQDDEEPGTIASLFGGKD